MTRAECAGLLPGTKLIVGDRFLDGADPDIEEFFGQVITFDRFVNNKWVYFKEGGDCPFRYDELVGVYNMPCIDDETIPYQSGDICLIFGEVC